MKRTSITSWLAILLLAGFVFTDVGPVWAGFTLDRDYKLGDDDNDAGTPSAGAQVGVATSTGDTFDSAGSLIVVGELVDLSPSNGPVYADTSTRPMSSGTLGVQFDGTDDFISGDRLGLPSTSFSSSGGANLGPLDYTGIANRGYQFWVRPNSSGQGNSTSQSIVADTAQHAVRISETDTWVMRYGGADIDSGVAVTFDSWSHVMLARPNGVANGATLWVDGVAVVRAPGGYDGADDTPLVIGANSGATPGTEDFFAGIVDNLEMFVLGTSSDMGIDYGTFSFATDNEIASAQSFTPGDATGDNMVTDADVNVFVANWRTEQLVNDLPAGDINSPSVADFNFDGVTDIQDWHHIAINHENGASLNLAALLAGRTVPEPSGLILFSIGATAFACRKRRHIRAGAYLTVALSASLCLMTQSANAVVINFNFGTAAAGTSTPGGLISGTVNDVPLAGSGTIVDSTGGATTISIIDTTANWAGDNNSDPDVKFDNAAATYTDAVARSIFWGGDTPTVTIQGLDADTSYSVGIVSASTGTTTAHDWFLNGVQVADDLPESAGTSSIPFFVGTTDGAGDLIVLSNDHTGGGVGLLQALVLDTDVVAFPQLTINRGSGLMTFTTSGTVSFSAYEIESNVGGFDPSVWTSIAENYDMDSGGSVDSAGNWVEFTDPADHDNLAEGRIGVATDFVNETVSLGNAWIRNPFEDVAMNLLMADGTTQLVPVVYEGGDPVSLADLDANGAVNVADWNSFKPQFATDTSALASDVARWLQGDLNLDGIVNLRDAGLFAIAYDEANGGGAFAATIGSVPEPAGLALFGISLVILTARSSRKQGVHRAVSDIGK